MGELTQRMDVLDVIIEVLREHEKALDDLVDRLTKAMSVAERHAMQR